MKKLLTFLLCCILLLSVICSCSASPLLMNDSSSSTTPEYGKTEENDVVTQEETTAESESSTLSGLGDLSGNITSDGGHKLVYTANYSINSKQFDSDYNEIIAAASKYNGYVSSEETSGTKPVEVGDYGRSSTLTLRIPVDSYSVFTAELSGIGEITQKSQNTDDITSSYADVESRISLLETQYSKLDAHLQQATKMSDIIELEEEMASILNELDTLKSTQRGYDDMVAYTTINITLTEKVKSSEIVASKEDFWERASDGFNASLNGVGSFFEDFGVLFISALPVLIILAVIAAIVIIIVVSVKKARNKKGPKKPGAPPSPKDQPTANYNPVNIEK